MNTTTLTSELSSVKVYLNRAELELHAKTEVTAGEHTLVFTGISPRLDKGSIQVKGKGQGLIRSVTHREVYHQTPAEPGLYEKLAAQIKEVEQQLQEVADERFVLSKEEETLLANATVPQVEGIAFVQELVALTAHSSQRLPQLRAAQRQAQLREQDLNDKLAQLRQQQKNLSHRPSKTVHEVHVAYATEQPEALLLQLTYLADGASWRPLYDIRVGAVGQNIQLHCKASILNQTQVDWLQVPLRLSTMNPTLSGSLPVLHPWYLIKEVPMDYEGAMPAMSMDMAMGGGVGAAAAAPMKKGLGRLAAEMEESQANDMATTAMHTEVSQNLLSIEYSIPIRNDVPSGGNPTTLDVQLLTPEISYRHYAVPVRDPDAFLQGLIKGWEKLNLIPGPANVFLEGSFVGTTHLAPKPGEEELRIGLGRDKNVLLKREAYQETSGKSLLGGSIKRSYGYELVLHNTRAQEIELELQDYLPVSQDKEIEVKILDLGGAELDPEKGFLTWQLKLKAGEQRKLRFSYEVKYPKNVHIANL